MTVRKNELVLINGERVELSQLPARLARIFQARAMMWFSSPGIRTWSFEGLPKSSISPTGWDCGESRWWRIESTNLAISSEI